jgi:hypothetical protein
VVKLAQNPRQRLPVTDQQRALIDKYRQRMAMLHLAVARDGYLYAISRRDETYAIFLSPNGSSSAPWRLTSFRNGEPVGHREYNMLEGGSPIQNAYQEFSGDEFRLIPRTRRVYSNSPQL